MIPAGAGFRKWPAERSEAGLRDFQLLATI
jgi:hypothetical protein